MRDGRSRIQRREGGKEGGRELSRRRAELRRAELRRAEPERRDGLLSENRSIRRRRGAKGGPELVVRLVFALFGKREWDPDRAAYSEILDPKFGSARNWIGGMWVGSRWVFSPDDLVSYSIV